MPNLALDDLYRHHYARLVAGLTRVFGPARLDLVEDVVQDAMVKAMRTWPFSGIPDDPPAWITRVAHNLALDALRRRATFESKSGEVASTFERRARELETRTDPDEIGDDSLRMIFTCCHPALPPEARVALTLKTMCGFGSREIASALLTKEATVAQRLSRAKAKLQREAVAFEVPGPHELEARLDSVLEVIYLVFNEGYRAHRGAELVRADLVADSVRLAQLLVEMPETRAPQAEALLALMWLLGSRLPARIGDAGEILTLAQQDRTKWDRDWIAAGFRAFERSIRGGALSPYHVEAAIASVHAQAVSYAATDWRAILRRYDELLALRNTPLVRLNRAVALAKVEGVTRAREELTALTGSRDLDGYVLLPATEAHFAWLDGDRSAALEHYEHALSLHCTEPERALLEQRRAACASGSSAPNF